MVSAYLISMSPYEGLTLLQRNLRINKSMNIILEGLWYGPVKVAAEAMAAKHPELVERVHVCPPVIESPEMVNWMRSLTRSMEVWRRHAPSSEVKVFKHSPLSCVAYTEVYSRIRDNEFASEERELFNEIVDGLSELLIPPDLVLIFDWDVEIPTPTEKDLYYASSLETLKAVQDSINRWGAILQDNGVRVIHIAPPKDPNDHQSWHTWYQGVSRIITMAVKEAKTDNGHV